MYAHIHAIEPRLARWLAMSHGGHQGGGHGRHGRRGRGPWDLRDFGPRGRRARRGDVRAALLVLLAEEPRNGYQLMQEIEQRSEGAWRPSPGSVYPALQQLEDEGLVRTTEVDGRRAYELTEDGRDHVERRSETLGAPWDAVREDAHEGHWPIMHLIRQVAMATTQIVQAGNDAQVAQAEAALTETRRTLYRILAEDEPSDDAPGDPPQEA